MSSPLAGWPMLEQAARQRRVCYCNGCRWLLIMLRGPFAERHHAAGRGVPHECIPVPPGDRPVRVSVVDGSGNEVLNVRLGVEGSIVDCTDRQMCDMCAMARWAPRGGHQLLVTTNPDVGEWMLVRWTVSPPNRDSGPGWYLYGPDVVALLISPNVASSVRHNASVQVAAYRSVHGTHA